MAREGHLMAMLSEEDPDTDSEGNQRDRVCYDEFARSCRKAYQILEEAWKFSETKEELQRYFEAASKGKLQEFRRLYNENPERIHFQDNSGNTVLHLASANGHLNIVDFILQNEADMNVKNGIGNTALHEAVKNEQTTIIEFLLKNEADPTILNDMQMAPIHLAVDIGSLSSLDALLKHKSVDVKQPGEGGATPLHYCAYKDRADCAQKLFEHGAKPCTKCHHGYYPIHAAARSAAAKTLEVIIKYVENLGYTRDEVLSFEDKENNTALHCAVNSGHPEAVRVCLNAGAPVDAQQEDKSTPLHFACAQGGLEMIKIMYELQESKFLSAMNTPDVLKMTPLHRAALFNHVDVVEYLLDKGADINALDASNRTPLFVAASKKAWNTVNLLIKKGANMAIRDEKNRNFLHVIIKGGGSLNMFEEEVIKNVKNLLNETDEHGSTPLHYATREGQLNAIDALINMGAFLNAKNKKKQSPLHFAAKYGRYNTCKRLLNSKEGPGIINETDEDGLTALHYAAKNGHVKIITLLMQKGAYVTRDHEDNSPLHMAVLHGYTRSMKSILNVHGNLLNCPNKVGNTPLHTAAEVGQLQSVTLLLNAGARFSINENGKSFLDLAIDNKHSEVAAGAIKHERWIEVLSLVTNAGCGMSRLIEHLPDVAMLVLDKCQTFSTTPSKENKKATNYIDYNFQFLQVPYAYMRLKEKEGVAIDPLYTLNLMVRFGRVELLNHPVCKAYLSMKWRAYGVWLYSLNFIIYIIFLAMLTYLVTLPCNKEHLTDNGNTTNQTTMSGQPKTCEYKYGINITCTAWLVLIFTLLNIVKEIFQMIQQNIVKWTPVHMAKSKHFVFIARVKYFTEFNNYMEWILYLASAFFVGPLLFGFSDRLQIEPGAVAIFLAWFNCLLFLQRFDVFGIYVVMFLEILRTLLQALSVFSLLIVAFGLAFYLLLKNETTFAYSTPGLSLLRTGIMMLELDYMASFNDPYTDNDRHTLQYTTTTVILLVVFVLTMPILLMNLLIGLAVGDIEAVQKDATLKRLAMQVELHTDIERRLPKGLLERVDKVNYRIYPACKSSFLSHIWSKMTWQNVGDDESSKPLSENSEMAMELVKQKNKIKQLSALVEKNNDLLKLIVQKMEIKTEDEFIDEGDPNTIDELQCKANCQKVANKWKSEAVQKNIKQSMVVSKWRQVSADKEDNNIPC